MPPALDTEIGAVVALKSPRAVAKRWPRAVIIRVLDFELSVEELLHAWPLARFALRPADKLALLPSACKTSLLLTNAISRATLILYIVYLSVQPTLLQCKHGAIPG